MRKVYVCELKPYSLQEIAKEFDVGIEEVRKTIEQLIVRGIVRYRKTDVSNDAELFDEVSANPDELYVFEFVGMALVGDLVLISYPKYFRDGRPDDATLKQLFRVLRRGSSLKNLVNLVGEDQRTADKLPIMLALLDLYAEYGVYSNYIDGRELNGAGVIDWNRTIGYHLPIVSNGQPIYVEYESHKTFRDDSDYITRLHRAVLSECARELIDVGIADLLAMDVDAAELSNEDIDNLGGVDELELKLERERGVQYVDWKVSVLELLVKYLLSRENGAENSEIKVLGTSSFHCLWEKACKVAFGDKLDVALRRPGIDLRDEWRDKRKDNTLREIIPHPKWERWSEGSYGKEEATGTLIPDTVNLVSAGGRRIFGVYDAKYYVPTLSGKMEKQPGLESVAKQFLYQAAYRPFVEDHGFDAVVNAFLVPTSDSELHRLARVSFEEVMGTAKPPLSNYIVMWALPAHDVFDAYLHNAGIADDMLQTIWECEK